MTNNTRKKILAKLEKQASLNKKASDIVDDVNNANIEDPQEFAHKIFESLLNNIHIEGLDDDN